MCLLTHNYTYGRCNSLFVYQPLLLSFPYLIVEILCWWPHSLFLTAKVCPIRRARLATTITAAISILMSLLLADKDTSSYRSRQLWLLENSASSWNQRSRPNYYKTFCSAFKVCSKQDYTLLSSELLLFCEG